MRLQTMRLQIDKESKNDIIHFRTGVKEMPEN